MPICLLPLKISCPLLVYNGLVFPMGLVILNPAHSGDNFKKVLNKHLHLGYAFPSVNLASKNGGIGI